MYHAWTRLLTSILAAKAVAYLRDEKNDALRDSANTGKRDSSSPTPQQQIQPLLHEMDTAANAHDTDRFMAPFQHTDRLVFVINGHVIHGWTALRDQQRQWWLNGKTDVVYTPNSASEFTVLRPDLVAVTRVFSSSRTASDGQAAKWDFAVST